MALAPVIFVERFFEILEAETKQNPIVRKANDIPEAQLPFKGAPHVASRGREPSSLDAG
jgi:hypothetical protein